MLMFADSTIAAGSVAAAVAGAVTSRRPAPVAIDEVPLSEGAYVLGEPGERAGQVREISRSQPFSLVGLRAAGELPSAMVRTQLSAGEWTPWRDFEPADGAEHASEPLWTGPATRLQVLLAHPEVAFRVQPVVVLVDPGTSPADALAKPGSRDVAVPEVVSRERWEADEDIRCAEPRYDGAVVAATVHHTAGSNSYDPDDSARMVRGIYAYHAKTLGWCDIGYNALVDKYGRVFEGRYGGLDAAVHGAHAGGFNTGTFGVAILGELTSAEPTDGSLDALSGIVAWKFALSQVDPAGTVVLTSAGGGTAKYPIGTPVQLRTIFGHRDVGDTECPGDNGYAALSRIRQRVSERMGVGQPPPEEQPPPPELPSPQEQAPSDEGTPDEAPEQR
jgi:uncharacterized protein with LGFP repeats